MHAAPQELRSHVVRGSEFPANPGEFGRFPVATLAVQDLCQHPRGCRDIVALPHLLERLVIPTKLALRRLEIAGEHFDECRIEGDERGEEPVSELLEQYPASPV